MRNTSQFSCEGMQKYKALFDYEATDAEEGNLKEGDILEARQVFPIRNI